MGNPNKNVRLRALIDAAITELRPETSSEQILLNGDTTLADKLAEMIAAINLRAKIETVDSALNDLKEELTDQIGEKAAQTVVDDVINRLNSLGALASKDQVSESDLDGDLQAVLDSKVPKTRTVNKKALSSDITLSASDVGADPEGSADDALAAAKKYADETYAQATAYADTKITSVIDGAPETMDTLKEVAKAFSENATVVEALNSAIGTKANQAELDTHTGNETIHITASERALWNTVEKKVEKDTTYEMDVTTTSEYSNVENSSLQVKTDTNTIKLVDGDGTEVSTETVKAVSEVTLDYASQTSGGLMSKDDKAKLDGIAAGAEVNQNAFNKMVVGSTTISATTRTDSLTLAAGSNVTLTPDASGKKITIAAKDTTYSEATESSSGLMSAEDKTNLDALVEESLSIEAMGIVQTSDRTLSDSHAGGIKLIGIKGASEQKQYSGKNLLEITAQTTTKEGITFTMNNDGSVTVNGTATANATHIIVNGKFFVENGGKEVILSGNVPNSNVKLQIWQGVGNAPITDLGNGEKGVLVERDESLSQNVALSVVSGATVNNVTIYPMVRLASIEDSTYEPYVGGTASPNPVYPQEIESVGIENLANDDYLDIYADKDTKLVTQVSNLKSILIAVKPNTTYLLGRTGGTQYSTVGYFNTIPQAGDTVENVDYFGSTAKVSITTKEDTNYILWYVASPTTISLSEVFCYETTDADAEYKPYGYSLGIKAEGKNKFTGWVMGGYISPTTGAFTTSDGDACRTDYIEFDPTKSYFLSGIRCIDGSVAFGFTAYYDENKKYISRQSAAIYADRRLQQVPSNAKYVAIAAYYNSDKAPNFSLAKVNHEVQLEEGAVATPYEPYRSKSITIPLNEPLRKGDEIVVVDGVWGKDKGRGKTVLDGSEDEVYTYNSSLGTFWISLPNAKAHSSNVLCTHYTDMGDTLSSANDYGFHMFSALHFRNKDASTLEEWRAILAENPITVQYELATPVFEPFEDQTPFYGLTSFDTVTYISTDSEVEPEITVEYGTSKVGAYTLGNYNDIHTNAEFETEDIDWEVIYG